LKDRSPEGISYANRCNFADLHKHGLHILVMCSNVYTRKWYPSCGGA